ncbi:hypothetical protein I6A84_40955 [Frankia sp. CNm7]|uniref:O-antigen ligase like membrane protein n=1 Tax=Frankia nepalensis TaxID=1836974 RepID=A0A937UJZ1_9ACTN|nr:hypothetical protein [Frankia nepalensis]MBL7498560.1 hypothetical protein [Frankia nepalensis]MBL7513761.1 hypothetical protein [Frankia nepalensis]MBL7524243.1 hypothetical protein [Frankia nepalensis]MBL7626279.1 hypothetical protein [Frankia nepalensis]
MVTTLTTRIPRTWVIPTPDAAARDAEADRATLRMLTILLACEIFLQRIMVPMGGTGVPIVLPILFVGSALLLARGALRTHLVRTRAYLVAMAVCAFAAFVSFSRGEPNSSVNSLLLLLATYAPFCLGLARAHSTVVLPRLLDRFVIMTSILAGLAVLQFAIQLAGWTYTDIIEDIVPPNFLAENFNTSYPVRYGSDLYKSNAFIGLEPSFTSQFLAVGLVVSVLRRTTWWRVLLFILAILSTVSGTGILLLGVASVLLAIHKGLKFTLSALAVVGILAGILSFTPAAKIFADRATETSSSESSGNLRFVTPYERTYDNLADSPQRTLFGNGPGWSDRDAAEYFARTQLPLNYALLPKLLLEYGVIAGLAFLTFLATAFVRGSPSFVLSGTLLFFYVVLSSSLLNPVVGYLVLLLLSWFCEDKHPLVARKPAYRAPRVPTQRTYAGLAEQR